MVSPQVWLGVRTCLSSLALFIYLPNQVSPSLAGVWLSGCLSSCVLQMMRLFAICFQDWLLMSGSFDPSSGVHLRVSLTLMSPNLCYPALRMSVHLHLSPFVCLLVLLLVSGSLGVCPHLFLFMSPGLARGVRPCILPVNCKL